MATSNYHLHQWERGDHPTRAALNEDFRTIDTALHDTHQQAERSLEGVARVGYHAASVMLQQGKAGGSLKYQNGLFAEPFYDRNNVSSVSGFFYDYIDHRMVLSNQNPTAYTYYYGDTNQTAFTAGKVYTLNWDCQRTGILSKADYHLTGGSSSGQVKFELLDSSFHPIGETFTGGADGYETVTLNYTVEKGKSYIFRVTNISGSTLQCWSLPGANFGLRYYIGYPKSSSGSMVTPSLTVPAYTGARAWVRHSSGTVTPSLLSSGTWNAMELESQRSAYTVEGIACQERMFLLEGLAPSATTQIRLEATASSGAINLIYEYAILLL